MARAYNDDLCGKVLAAHAAGKGTMKQMAEHFSVSYGWVRKVAASRRRTGSAARLGQRRAPSRVDLAKLRDLMLAQPDAVLGVRVHGSVPGGHWKMLTLLGAMDHQGIAATMTVEAATDREVFLAIWSRCCAPNCGPAGWLELKHLQYG